MSHERTHRYTADQDDPHNHKHTGTSAFLNLSDRFFAPLDRQIVAWLQLAPGSRVLDAGCGSGGMTRLLAQAVGSDGEVFGLDANAQLIEGDRSQVRDTDVAGQIQFQEGDVLHLPFEDGTFDLVWCSRVIHGLSDQVAGVRELARVVRPGGRVVLREGGLLPRFLPFDVGLGDPGLQGRLEVAHEQMFANWRGSLPNGVAYPYGWSHILREVGLREVMPKSFLHEFASSLEASQKDYLESWLSGYLRHPEHKQRLSARDISTLEQLLDPASPQYVFARDDLHGIVVETVYVGSLLERNHV
ncbi:MAG TPA: methyltransferase domain-containing protein [Ktedonobacteraceae bacterium]|nr:methyltransferase domain-containing protein [Ktedonobacteraceae bacterium]